MERFGFLSFGHYTNAPGSQTTNARDMLHQAVELAEAADELGVNGAFFRVHHFARQQASPFPLLAAIAARTERIEMGTGVVDLRYENPLYLAEETAATDLLSDGRLQLGVSRGSPETVVRGYEHFGYHSDDPRGADIAREKFDVFMNALDGHAIATAESGVGKVRIEPHSPGVRQRIWWGAATRETAEWAAAKGVNLMSSTLLTEATGKPFHELQHEQIERYRAAWTHAWQPRVSVSRSIFPITSDIDRQLFGARTDHDQIGVIDGLRSTFGKTYVGEPDELIEQLRNDSAVMSADTLMLTIPNQLGVAYNAHLLASFAEHVAPELGWIPNNAEKVAA